MLPVTRHHPRNPRTFVILGSALGLFALASCTTPPAAQPPTAESKPAPAVAEAKPAPVDALQSLIYPQSQQPVVDLDRDIAAAGNDPAKLAPIATRLLDLLHSPATTFAARQAICQRLGEFPASLLTAGDAFALFAKMLADDTEINLARLALERVPSPAIDTLFLNALKAPAPGTRLALVQSAGNRHLAAAVPLLAPALRDPDSRVASAAARALAQIATPAALAALGSAPDPAAPDIVEARLTLARSLPTDRAVSVFEDIISTPHAPANLRAAALRGIIDVEPDAAPARIVAALSGTDPVVKAVVIEAIASLPAKNLTRVLASQLSTFDASTQAAVIAALGRRGDPAADGAIATATTSADPAVRTAALTALGLLPGTPATAAALAAVAANGELTDAKLARLSLARLDGPGVADAVVAGAKSGPPALRVVYLESLASRYMTETVPLLLQTRADPDASIRTAALGSLAELAPASAQAEILAWALAAADPSEQSRALRAVANVTLRNPDLTTRARPIAAAIEQAPSALAIRLLPVLPRLGGATAAACAAKLAQGDDVAVADAAITTLSRWPDLGGLTPLIDTAASASHPAVRTTALAAATRFLDRDRSLASSDLETDLSRLLDSTQDAGARKHLVYLLGRCSDDAALALAGKLTHDPELATDAADAALAIRANRAGPPDVSVSDSHWGARFLLDGNPATRWSVDADAHQWFQLDFHTARPIRHLVLEETDHADEFPVGYAVFVTDNPAQPGAPRVTGAGTPGRTVIDLPPGTRGRYLIVRHVGERDGTPWTVSEVLID